MFNHCFEASYVDGHFVSQERPNATEWINEGKVCIENYCHNESGRQQRVLDICEDADPCYVGRCVNETGLCEYTPIAGYDELVGQQNKCYELVCEDNKRWAIHRRENATDWEDRTNDCMHYECHNESGYMSWSMCNSTKEEKRICMNEQCIVEDEHDKGWSVELDVKDLSPEELDILDPLTSIGELTGVDREHLSLAVEVDESGNIMRVVVFVKDEETATMLADTMNSIADVCKEEAI